MAASASAAKRIFMDPGREDGGATGYHMPRKHFTELRPMAAEIRIFNPDTLGKPLGQYSQIARVKNASELLFIAGQLPSDKAGALVGADDFDAQCPQVFPNIEPALEAAGGGFEFRLDVREDLCALRVEVVGADEGAGLVR